MLRSKKLVRNKVRTRFSFEAVRFLTLFLALFLARSRNKARNKARKDPQSGALGPDHRNKAEEGWNKAETRQEQGDISNIFCGAREQGLKQCWSKVKNKVGTMSQKQG